jgi:hypothetical protein
MNANLLGQVAEAKTLRFELLILMRFQIETNYPRPGRETSQAFVVCGEPGQALLQLSDDGIQVVEHPVGELLLAQFIPNMFLRGFSSGA